MERANFRKIPKGEGETYIKYNDNKNAITSRNNFWKWWNVHSLPPQLLRHCIVFENYADASPVKEICDHQICNWCHEIFKYNSYFITPVFECSSTSPGPWVWSSLYSYCQQSINIHCIIFDIGLIYSIYSSVEVETSTNARPITVVDMCSPNTCDQKSTSQDK